MVEMAFYYYTAHYRFDNGEMTDFKYCEGHTPSIWLADVVNVSISTVGPCYTCSVQWYKRALEPK